MTLRTHHLAALVLALALTLHAAGARAAAAEDTPSTSTWIKLIEDSANPNPALPTLWLIGDSTVRNGTLGNGDNGQWGWGAPIATLFDLKKINVINVAWGGTSSRSYQNSETHWKRVLTFIKPGDYVIMQFGHNDGGAVNAAPRGGMPGRGMTGMPGMTGRGMGMGARGTSGTLRRGGAFARGTGMGARGTSATLRRGGPPRGALGFAGKNGIGVPSRGPAAPTRSSIRGNGEETQMTRLSDGTSETVHTFGWYMRKYIADTKAKGATPIVCSLIPRNGWGADGKENRNNQDYALWAAEAAKQGGALFIDLHNLTADYFDTLGQKYVNDTYFTHPQNERVHPNDKGAQHIAGFVVAGIKALKDCKLKDYLAPSAADIKPAGPTELNK